MGTRNDKVYSRNDNLNKSGHQNIKNQYKRAELLNTGVPEKQKTRRMVTTIRPGGGGANTTTVGTAKQSPFKKSPT